MKIKHICHACVVVYLEDNTKITFDPFVLNEEQKNEIKDSDYVCLTHAHSDHIANLKDAVKENTKVICNFEMSEILRNQGYNTIGINLGGKFADRDFSILMVKAEHTSSFNIGGQILYGGVACGYVLTHKNKSIYFMGDTELFQDMKLICEMNRLDLILAPVGGTFTIDENRLIFASKKLLKAKAILPIHYNTFEAIKTDLKLLKEKSKIKIITPKLLEEIIL